MQRQIWYEVTSSRIVILVWIFYGERCVRSRAPISFSRGISLARYSSKIIPASPVGRALPIVIGLRRNAAMRPWHNFHLPTKDGRRFVRDNICQPTSSFLLSLSLIESQNCLEFETWRKSSLEDKCLEGETGFSLSLSLFFCSRKTEGRRDSVADSYKYRSFTSCVEYSLFEIMKILLLECIKKRMINMKDERVRANCYILLGMKN